MASQTFSTRVIADLASLQPLSPEWSDLWDRCPSATSFQRPEWVLAWAQAFRPKQLCVIEVRREQRLVGLAPLFLYTSGKETILAPLAASVSDYLDWLIDPSANKEILKHILEALQNLDYAWDRLDLTDIPATSSLLQFDFDDFEGQRSVETVCPVLTLPPGIKSVEEILPAKPRHNLRTARRRTERVGKAQVDIANERTLPEFLEAMMRLHGERWTKFGTSGVLAANNVRDFHRLAAPAFLQRGILRLYGLRLNGQLIATLYAFAERDVVYCYLQGFDPAYSALSPGAQILAAVIDDAIRDGKRSVDFLRGRESYKYAWGGRDQETYQLCLRLHASLRRVPPTVAA
jgi:CelD/BcsL family acetyltransferase involved in cellulose biosynthesis